MGRDDEIKLIAYNIWEQEGCPEGRECEHWYRAEAIWEVRQKPPMVQLPAKASAKPAMPNSKKAGPRKKKK